MVEMRLDGLANEVLKTLTLSLSLSLSLSLGGRLVRTAWHLSKCLGGERVVEGSKEGVGGRVREDR